MTRDLALVKAALEAAFRVCPTMSTAQANILALTNSHERLAAIAATVHEPLDHCGACGQWIGGPVECCHHSHEQPCVTASRAAEIRRAAEVKELVALRAEVDRLAACKFPDSRSIYVVTLPNGERWACADVVGAEIERLRARVAELEQERNEARSLLSTVNSSDYSLGLLVRELRARVAELEKDTERLAALAWGECLVDGIGGGDGISIHEEAAINASAFGRDEPNRDDYLAAIRTAIDAAMKEGK